jgi:hypothetical protein
MQPERGSSGSFAERTANCCWKAKCRDPGSAFSWELCRAVGIRRHALDWNLQLGLFVRAWPKPRGELAPLSCRSCCQESVAFSADVIKAPHYQLDRSCVPLAFNLKRSFTSARWPAVKGADHGGRQQSVNLGIDGAPTGIRTALVPLSRAEAVRFFCVFLMPSHASLRVARPARLTRCRLLHHG